jgi:shikimate dehydrogenase
MEKTGGNSNRFGLLGRNISYSFSKGYFTKKFKNLDLNKHSYENFDLANIQEFKDVISGSNAIKGMNVTIPYKEAIIPFLDELDETAAKIGAVNTIKFTKKGLKGFNTDADGFQKAIAPYLEKHHRKALILGTGGASKAIAHVLGELKIEFKFVSRNPKENQLSYADLNEAVMKNHSVIINCTPLGTYPNLEQKPDIPYQFITSKHLLFDLIYNPEKSAFLGLGEKAGASISNGYRMLEFQAEKSWEIWNSL